MYKTGMIPSPPDERDYAFKKYNTVHGLPVRFERPVLHLRDQGRMGSCVGFASAYAKDEQEHRNHPGRRYETAPLYTYAECKKIDGIPHLEGTYIRTANKVTQRQGICLETTFEYSDRQPIRPVPPEAHDEAEKYKIKHYTAIGNLHELKQAIVDHGYVVAGFIVLSSFLTPEKTDQAAFVPKPNGFILGGHAVSVIGYDDQLTYTYANGETHTGFIKIVNSWRGRDGIWWGSGGTAWIPYDILYRDIAIDLPGSPFLLEAWAWQDEITEVEPVEEIIMTIGSNEVIVDGEKIQIDQPPVIDPDSWRTLVPVNFVSDILGFDVAWNPKTREITIKRR